MLAARVTWRSASPNSLAGRVTDEVVGEARHRVGVEPNVDLALAALGLCAGMDPGAGVLVFAVARMAGWCAHGMEEWGEFIERHPLLKTRFEFEVMKLMSEVMAHTITLHLLDAPGRVARFMRKHEALVERLPKKELAAYLNLSPETLSRLKQRGKIVV